MAIADAFSRLSPEETNEVKGMNVQIHEICPQFNKDIIKRIKEATADDPELSALKEQNIHRLAFRHERSTSSRSAILGIQR